MSWNKYNIIFLLCDVIPRLEGGLHGIPLYACDYFSSLLMK